MLNEKSGTYGSAFFCRHSEAIAEESLADASTNKPLQNARFFSMVRKI
jgi:hypothetical protein